MIQGGTAVRAPRPKTIPGTMPPGYAPSGQGVLLAGPPGPRHRPPQTRPVIQGGTAVRVGTGSNARPHNPLNAVGNLARPPAGGGGNPVLGPGGANGCPVGYHDTQIAALQKVKEEGPGPLFKFVYYTDILKDYDIDKQVYVRVARSMIESVVLDGSKQFHVKTLAFFMNHVEGQLFVNTPTETDYHKLKLIMAIKSDTKTADVARQMFKNIDPKSFPIHFLLYSNWQVDESALMPKIASAGTTRRLVRAYKLQDGHDVRDEY